MNQAGGVFLNGKAQVIEMFKLLKNEEKERLLKIIKLKNPQLANELMQETVTFESIESLNESEIVQLFTRVKPAIWGLALKGTNRSFQHRILSLASREFAEQAYKVMTTYVDNEKVNNQRAQNKILEILFNLKKSELI